MDHKIDLIAGIEHFAKRASEHKLIFWDEENDFISCPPIDDESFNSQVYFTDVQSIVEATEENVKIINSNWDYYDLTAYKPTGAGMLFGVFGLIGDSLIRGYPVHFILTLNEDKPLFCRMFSKGYERLMEKYSEIKP